MGAIPCGCNPRLPLNCPIFVCLSRSELTKHPLDIRGSRRSLEAAKIFLKMQSSAEAKVGDKLEFLDTTIIKEKEVEKERNKDRIVCPTVACDWVAAKTLGCFRNGFSAA